MFNYSKLEGKIKEVCNSQAVFSSKIGLSERSISLKLNNRREWKPSEIQKACDILDIDAKDIPVYFFTLNVQN